MRQAKIFRYQRDHTQSFHRIVDGEEKTGILTYYESHVYMDSDFVPAGSVQYITRDSLLAKYRRDMDRVDRRFDILRAWGILPTRNCHILDLGCGYGAFIAQWMAHGFGHAYGIELSSAARQVSPVSSHIMWGDVNRADSLPIPGELSMIVALDVIEHLFDVKQVLKTLYRKTGPRLKMLIEIPIVKPGIDTEALARYKYLYPTRHLHLYTPCGIEQTLCECGYRLLQSKMLKDGNKCLMLIEKEEL